MVAADSKARPKLTLGTVPFQGHAAVEKAATEAGTLPQALDDGVQEAIVFPGRIGEPGLGSGICAEGLRLDPLCSFLAGLHTFNTSLSGLGD